VGKQFGRSQDDISVFGTSALFDPYQDVQILASGTSDTSNLQRGFISGSLIGTETNAVNYIGSH